MNERQKAFADYFIETDNATESAKRAGYSQKTAYSIGQRLLKHVEVQAYIKERLASKEKARVADQDEILEFLTSVMRGEVKDQLGLETPVKERRAAAVDLGKRHGMWIDKQQIEGGLSIKVALPKPPGDENGDD